MGSLEAGCGENRGLLSVAELESLVVGSTGRRNQGGLCKGQRNALKGLAASRKRRVPQQQERGLVRRTLGRSNAITRRRDSSTLTPSAHPDPVAHALLSLNNAPTRPAPPQVVLNGLNGALRIAQESSEVSRAKLWSALIQVTALPVGLEADHLVHVTEADARTALAKVAKSCYLDDAQPGCISPFLIKCTNHTTTENQTAENEITDSEYREGCDGGHRLINCQRLVDISTTREKVEVMATILNVTLARNRRHKHQKGYRRLRPTISTADTGPSSGLGLTRARKSKAKTTIRNEKMIIHSPPHRKSNGCSSLGGESRPRDAFGLRHELTAAEDSVARFTLAVRSDLAWVKSNAEVQTGKLTAAVPSLNLQVKRRCQKWGAEKIVGALYSALVRIKQSHFASWRSKIIFASLTELSVQYIRLRGANKIAEIIVKWGTKRSKDTLQRWSTTCKVIKRYEENRAALEVTRWVRGFLGRCSSRRLKHIKAASALQMAIRRWLALKELERRRENKSMEKASTVINGTTRVFLARRKLERLKMEWQNQTKASILIQTIVRGRKEKLCYQQMYQAIGHVQALVRVFNCRNLLKRKRLQRQKENESVIVLQRCFRRCLTRKHYSDILNERKIRFYATKIQHGIRRGTGCCGGTSLILPRMTVMELTKKKAALIIQRSVRSMLARREFQQLAVMKMNIQAASKIQSAFRVSRANGIHATSDASTTKTALINESGSRELEEIGRIDLMAAQGNAAATTTRLPHIMYPDSSDTPTYSGLTILDAKESIGKRNAIAQIPTQDVKQADKRKSVFPGFFRSKSEQKPERRSTKGGRLSQFIKDKKHENVKASNSIDENEIQFHDGLLGIQQSLQLSELANATKTAEIAKLERELRESKLIENQARLEAAQISERETERMNKKEANMVVTTGTELMKVKERLNQEEQAVDLLKKEKDTLKIELNHLKMEVEQERTSGRQEVINILQEFVHKNEQIEEEERTGNVSVNNTEQHPPYPERKQVREMLEIFVTEILKVMKNETMEVITQDLANERCRTQDQHDKIQSLSAELFETKSKLKALCEVNNHETLVKEGSAILAALDNDEEYEVVDEDKEEERSQQMMMVMLSKEKVKGSSSNDNDFTTTTIDEKDEIKMLRRNLAITQAKLDTYEKNQKNMADQISTITESECRTMITTPLHGLSALRSNEDISNILNPPTTDISYKQQNSGTKTDSEWKLLSSGQLTSRRNPVPPPSQIHLSYPPLKRNSNQSAVVDDLRGTAAQSIQTGRRITAANGGLLPINHHHSKNKKVLTHPERSGDVTTRHEMVNHQLPADWEEFWDDSVGASYFFNTSTQEATWTLPKGISSAEETTSTHITDRKVEKGEEDWIQQWDESSNRTYWFNIKKNETTWIKPSSILQSDTNNSSGVADTPGDTSSGLNVTQITNANPEEWVAYLDADKGQEYWYNTTTGEVKWS